MGICCKIYIAQPPNNIFTPGSIISGVIQYNIEKETDIQRIIISLKGAGKLFVTEASGSGKRPLQSSYYNSENYVNISNVIQNEGKEDKLKFQGQHEVPFAFKLPENVPSSMIFRQSGVSQITCVIMYYVRIKFQKSGIFSFDKRFKKDIIVVSGIVPRMSMEPVIFGEEKKLFQPFRSKDSVVNIKASMSQCVYKPGETVKMLYEVNNDTNKECGGVKAKVIQSYTFRSNCNREFFVDKDVSGTESKTLGIKKNETMSSELEIPLPSNLNSMDNCKFVSRDYFIVITAKLPMPHKNAVLKIPIQVGMISAPKSPISEFEKVEYASPPHDDQLPTYWEAMHECSKKNEMDPESFDDDSTTRKK